MNLLDVTGLTVSYAGSKEPVVNGLDFSLQAGEALGVVGESGAGKSQTALAIMGLLPPAAHITGQVCCDGFELTGKPPEILNRFRARRFSMVFQDPHQALNPYLRIGQQLSRVLLEHRMVRRKKIKNRALDLLRDVRLPDVERVYRCYPHELSGGMRQRVMIALALSCEPELLIADEPTTALDVTVQAQILALLRELRARTGIALLLITHDLGVVAETCERLLVLHGGRVLEQGATRDVFRNPSQQATRSLLAAAVRLDQPLIRRAHSPPPPAIEANSLYVSFHDGLYRFGKRDRRAAVSDASFSLARGETLAVVGESGCGKTSLARALAGLIPASSGSVSLLGNTLAARVQERTPAERRSLQMVFQDPVGSLNPAMTVASIIYEPVALHEPGLSSSERTALVASALQKAGLDESLLLRYPHELSGGQAQRVAISRALVLEPKVLICDEAVAALDGTVRRALLELLAAQQERTGMSILFITHDFGVVRQLSHRVMVMYMGRVVELGAAAQLFARPRHPYTRALMDAVPVADPERIRPPVPVAGEVLAAARVDGCPFHPRCAFAVEVCRGDLPARRWVDGVEVACHRAEELDLRGGNDS